MPLLRSLFATYRSPQAVLSVGLALALAPALRAQTAAPADQPASGASAAPVIHQLPMPALDLSSINKAADPCTDFYKFARRLCRKPPHPGRPAQHEPGLHSLQCHHAGAERDTDKVLNPSNQKTPNQQKIGDYYAACMNTDLINQKGLAPIQPLFEQIDKVSKEGLAALPASFSARASTSRRFRMTSNTSASAIATRNRS